MATPKKRGYYLMPMSSVAHLAREVDGEQFPNCVNSTPTAPITPEELDSRRVSAMGIIDMLTMDFARRVRTGELRIEKPQEFVQVLNAMISLEKAKRECGEVIDDSIPIDSPVLDADDPSVQEVFMTAFERMNERNDAAGEQN